MEKTKGEVVEEAQYQLKRFDEITKRLLEKGYDRLTRGSNIYTDWEDIVYELVEMIENKQPSEPKTKRIKHPDEFKF